MGRVKTFDRDEAVKTVMNEIWRNGYEACSVKSLSERLGLTRSSFYNSFGSREELFLEVLQVYFNQSPDQALEYIDGKKEVLKEICQVFRNVCITRSNDPEHRGCLAVNSVVELVGINDKVGPILSDAVQTSLQRFERLLHLAVERGELNDKNVHNRAIALQNLLIGINVTCKVIHDRKSLWFSTKLSLRGLDIYKNSFNL